MHAAAAINRQKPEFQSLISVLPINDPSIGRFPQPVHMRLWHLSQLPRASPRGAAQAKPPAPPGHGHTTSTPVCDVSYPASTSSLRRKVARCKTSRNALADRKSTRLNSSHANISYAVFCLKKKKTN